MNKNINGKIDYVTKDYEGFRKLMIDLIPTMTPEWTDYSESDLGIVLLELVAHVADILSYYQDKSFAEAILPTAQTRRSVIDLCKALGYNLKQQTPARFQLKVTKSADYQDKEVVISKGTKVSTDPSAGALVVFETDEDLRIGKGTLEGFVNVTQGETMSGEVVGAGTGQPNQKLQLGMADVLTDTLEVYTTARNQNDSDINTKADKTFWTQVDSFLNSSADDKHYMVDIDEFNNAYLVFGNGVSGMAVPSDVNVNANYRYGGGTIGNVGLNTINTIPFNDVVGIAQITNSQAPIAKGRDAESIEHAKSSAPRSFRMQDRCITRQDFIDICLMDEDVARVEVVESFNTKGEVYIYIVPSDFGDTVPKELKDRLLAKINKRKLLKDVPIIKDPTYLEFDIDIQVFVYSNFVNSQVKEALEVQLRKAFGVQNMEYNEEVLIANIYNECLSISGVKNIKINKPTDDVLVYDSETKTPRIAKLRNLTIAVKGGVE